MAPTRKQKEQAHRHKASVYNPPNMVDREAVDGEVVPGQWRELLRGKALEDMGHLGSNAYTRLAKSVRDQFKSYFVSPDGQVCVCMYFIRLSEYMLSQKDK